MELISRVIIGVRFGSIRCVRTIRSTPGIMSSYIFVIIQLTFRKNVIGPERNGMCKKVIAVRDFLFDFSFSFLFRHSKFPYFHSVQRPISRQQEVSHSTSLTCVPNVNVLCSRFRIIVTTIDQLNAKNIVLRRKLNIYLAETSQFILVWEEMRSAMSAD